MFFTELRAFHAVAQSGGFIRASELISRSQSTLTAQVLSLEQRYGVELFFRGRGRTAVLTPLGKKLHATTIQLFSLEKDAEALVMNAGQNRGGILRVGAISPRWATGMMTQMMKRYPDIEVNLTLDNSKNLLDLVLSYEIDLAYVGAHLPKADCEMRSISTPEIVFAVSKKHPLCAKGLVSRDEFKQQTLIQREIGSETRNLMDTALAQNGYNPGRTAILAVAKVRWKQLKRGWDLRQSQLMKSQITFKLKKFVQLISKFMAKFTQCVSNLAAIFQ